MKVIQQKMMLGLLALAFTGVASLSASGFSVTNLVSDIPGNAKNTDRNIINPWDVTFDKKGNLVVVSNGTDFASSFSTKGAVLPFAFNVSGSPTCVERIDAKKSFPFMLDDQQFHSEYLFVSEQGTILAYNKNANPNNAIIVADRSADNVVYKGMAMGTVNGEDRLYATDFHNGYVDVYNGSFELLFSFTDTTVPAGYAPFNARVLNGNLYVTFALQDVDGQKDVPGMGNGIVDIFSLDGVFLNRLIVGDQLNSPWGLAIAPKKFGQYGDALLVGNFGNGVINAFDPHNGAFLGALTDKDGAVLSIDGLWSIKFSPDEPKVLYFAAGTEREAHGTVGKITAK